MRYVNVKENNQICSPLKTSQQVTLNKAHVIEITKACTVVFMKARSRDAERDKKKENKNKNKQRKKPPER